MAATAGITPAQRRQDVVPNQAGIESVINRDNPARERVFEAAAQFHPARRIEIGLAQRSPQRPGQDLGRGRVVFFGGVLLAAQDAEALADGVEFVPAPFMEPPGHGL